jgi:tetratricopeptide (TPR) repeat protein
VKRTMRAGLVAILAVTMFSVGGLGLVRWVHSDSAATSRRPIPGAARGAVAEDQPLIGSASLPQAITNLQAHLRTLPRDWQSWAQLGSAYVQQARVTADPSYYPKAEGALRRSLSVDGTENYQAMTGMASLAAARHDFAGALRWAQRAASINPDNADVFAVMGDALIELGRYDEAFQTFQKAIDLRPDLSTYARASYAWELQGSFTNAVQAMELARSTAASPADAAWCENQLGDLYFNAGALATAEAHYQRAAADDPSFIPPQAGLARVEAARGQTSRAIAAYRSITLRYPLPAYVIALDDLYTVSGGQAEAARETGLLQVEERLFQANGVNVDLEIALFDADHRVNLAGGLAAAQAEWSRRQSVHVADALAWELYANGRAAEALPYANQALKLGYRNALFYYHRGTIERALGQDVPARRDLAEALRINPAFSILWSKPAANALAALGVRP